MSLLLDRDRLGGELARFLPHNVRQGFHALYALAHFRGDAVIAMESFGTDLMFFNPVDG